jgi:hypothetical protein
MKRDAPESLWKHAGIVHTRSKQWNPTLDFLAHRIHCSNLAFLSGHRSDRLPSRRCLNSARTPDKTSLGIMAKAYMLRSWGVDLAWVREEMDSAANEFNGALTILMARPENTDQIRSELQK